MRNSMPDDHVDDLRLPYLEGLLDPTEASKFEDHVRKCADCGARLEEMRRSVSVLAENPQVMCPEPWELFEYARSNRAPIGISSHLDKCRSCAEITASFKVQYSKKGMPEDLWTKMRDLAGEQRPVRHGLSEWFAELTDTLLNYLRPVALIPATVAVAILVFALILPTRPNPTTVALSSVSWGPTSPGLNLLGKSYSTTTPGVAKKRLAIVILLSSFRHLPDQKDIDSFYRSVEPPIDIRDKYDVVSPAQIGPAIGKDIKKLTDEKSIAKKMRSELGLSLLLTIDIKESEKNRFGIRARLMDTATGKIIAEKSTENLTGDELGPVLERVALAALKPERTGQ